METIALLLIDLQRDYFPGGRMELIDMNEAAEQAARLLEHFRRRKLPVIHIQHVSTRPGAGFFLPDTEGVEIHPTLAPLDSEKHLIKHAPNSFRDTDLHRHLQELSISELLICGAMTHMCIDTSVRAAFDLGYTLRVAADACATRDLVFQGQQVPAAQVQAAFLAALASPFARVLPTSELLAGIE